MDKNKKTKKITINNKTKIIYCSSTNKRVEYVKHNIEYIKLSVFKKILKKNGGMYGSTFPTTKDMVSITDDYKDDSFKIK